ncbi:SpoIID/LytB domain-containing protein, partial [uncultured Duncaniella sp.]
MTGEQEATLSDSGIAIVWNGKNYTSIEFTPTSYDGDSFELEDVVIGVDFHWQRKERQQFRGSIRLIVSDGNLTAVNIVKVEDYLISVISSEMSSTSSLPLLRAHAVISRSWLLAQMRHRSTPRVDSFRRSDTEITRW